LCPVILLIAITYPFLGCFEPIFIQERIGKSGNTFLIYKFRSLFSPDENRALINFGQLLRFSSLDELPQLVNVIRGDMSLVGPRPLLPGTLNPEDQLFESRHLLRPGLTGLAQISGRKRITLEEKLQLDLDYISSWSIQMDLVIMLKTWPVLFDATNQLDQ